MTAEIIIVHAFDDIDVFPGPPVHFSRNENQPLVLT